MLVFWMPKKRSVDVEEVYKLSPFSCPAWLSCYEWAVSVT